MCAMSAPQKTYCISIFIGNTYAQSEKRVCLNSPKAQQPWLAAGISRSTWYRRQKKAREQGAAALALTMRQAALDRLEWQITRLRADLEKAARFADEGAAILDELAGVSFRNGL